MERSEDYLGYGRLAAAVIVVAVQDYTETRLTIDGGPGSSRIVSKRDQQSAERFLNSRDLDFWAIAAGLEAQALREKVLRLEVRL
jgi:hypothetical protein